MVTLLLPEPEVKFQVPLDMPDNDLIYGTIRAVDRIGFSYPATNPLFRSGVTC